MMQSRASARAPGGEGSAAGARADANRPYNHLGYGPDGQKWSQQRTSGGDKGPSFRDAQEFSESEGGSSRRRKHQSPFERGSSSHYAGDQYDVNASPVSEQPSAGAPVTTEDGPSDEKKKKNALEGLSLDNVKGMTADMCLVYHGSPLDFARKSADLRPPAGTVRGEDAKARGQDAVGARKETFNPTVYHIPKEEVQRHWQTPEERAALKDPRIKSMSQMTADRKTMLPLAVHVDSYHNPFSFPVGIRAKHADLNRTVKGSSGKFMCVLPPGTGNAQKTIDLRPKISVEKVHAGANIATQDLNAMWKDSGSDAPDLVMVKENSQLHKAIYRLVRNGQTDPIDLGALPVIQCYGGRYLDGVPKAAAMYAVDKMQRVKESSHAKMPIDDMSFEIHPLNYEERWDGTHLTREGFDARNNKTLHEDYLNTPQCVTVGMRMDYL